MKIGIKIGEERGKKQENDRGRGNKLPFLLSRMEEGRMEGEGKAGFLTMGGEIVSPRLRVNLVQLSAG